MVSDIGIPGMNGIELGKRIRANYPDLPIVAFTGSAVGEKAVEEVYDKVFEKPIDLDRMVKEVQRVLLIKDE